MRAPGHSSAIRSEAKTSSQSTWQAFACPPNPPRPAAENPNLGGFVPSFQVRRARRRESATSLAMNPDRPLTDSAVAESALPKRLLLRVALLCVMGVVSLYLTKLALFATVALLLGYVSLPSEPKATIRTLKVCLLIAG